MKNLVTNTTYSIEQNNDQVYFIDSTGEKQNLGLVLNLENIKEKNAQEWFNCVEQKITTNLLCDFIIGIDSTITSKLLDDPKTDNFQINYGTVGNFFDNTQYSYKFSKSELKLTENKINFFKYCFQIKNLDLDKILEAKFPNCLVEYKPNFIQICYISSNT